MGLIADTGIVLDILARHPADALHDAMFRWTAKAVGRIEPPPRGRSVAMFVSADAYRDYKARLGQAGIATRRSCWDSLRRQKFTMAVSRPSRPLFTMQAVKTSDGDAARWTGDRFGRAFFSLLAAVGRGGAWLDRQITFASRDRDASSRMRDMATALGHAAGSILRTASRRART